MWEFCKIQFLVCIDKHAIKMCESTIQLNMPNLILCSASEIVETFNRPFANIEHNLRNDIPPPDNVPENRLNSGKTPVLFLKLNH